MVDTTLFELSRMEQARITGKPIKAERRFLCLACDKSYPMSMACCDINNFRITRRRKFQGVSTSPLCSNCMETIDSVVVRKGKYTKRHPKAIEK